MIKGQTQAKDEAPATLKSTSMNFSISQLFELVPEMYFHFPKQMKMSKVKKNGIQKQFTSSSAEINISRKKVLQEGYVKNMVKIYFQGYNHFTIIKVFLETRKVMTRVPSILFFRMRSCEG